MPEPDKQPDTATARKLLDNLSTAVIWLNDKLHILYINSAAEALFEVSGRQVTGEPLTALRLGPDNPLADVATAAANGAVFSQREAQLQLNSGLCLTVDCAATPITDTEPQSLLLELQALDRMVKISREEHLLAVQQASHTLIRGLAHEIKNPLGGIRGAAQLLAKQHQNSGEYTQVIIAEADRLRHLVDNMLGPNKATTRQAINIHQVLHRVEQLIAAETDKTVKFMRDFDPSIPDLNADTEQLIQAVLNVTRNAMQALLESDTAKPVITLKTRVVRQFTIGDTRFKLVCAVHIIDNGPGIPANLLDKLFFPLVSGRASGSGLGLAIAQQIVQRHQGLIECSQAAGHTCFTLYLPLEPHHE